MARKSTKAEQISKRTYNQVLENYRKTGLKGLRSDVQFLRNQYKRRAQSFKRNNVVSYAQIAFEKEKSTRKELPVSKMNYNQLLLDFFRYATFFNSDTATLQGVKKVNREQDKRIFGETKNGRPLRTMTNEQRKLYWDIYDEYKSQYKDHVNQVYSSSYVQHTLADQIIDIPEFLRSDEDFNETVLTQFLANLSSEIAKRKSMEGIKDVPNQFSGRRDDFHW